MIASASRNLLSMTTILPRSICWTSPESSSPTLPENSSRMRERSPSRTRWMMRCFAAWTAVRPNCSNGTSSPSTSPGAKSGSSYRASSSETWVPGSSMVSTTVLRTTIRIDPFISSIPISARPLGPSRPTNCTQWRCQRTVRSIPGLDTSKTYLLPRGPPASSHSSSARLTRLQSSTVTFRGGQSMRTWTSGRFGVPPMRRSARSNPNASSRVRKASTRLSVSMKKKRGPNFARITVGNVAGGLSMSTERAAEIRCHAAVAPLRGPMRQEPIAPLGATPGRGRDLLDPEVPRVPREDGAEVELDGAGYTKAHCDFRTNFITGTANTYPTMHYDVARFGKAAPLQQLDALLQNAVRGPPPPGVDQCDRSFLGDCQIHRNAVGDGHRQQ